MEYLKRVLGIRVIYPDDSAAALPNYITARYRLQKATLDGKPAVFVYPVAELDPVDAIKKHLRRIESAQGMPAILVPDHLTYRQKEYLLRDRIPFIVDGRQIYLPFMAVFLQERGDGERTETDVMLPSAQLLLLHYIGHGCGEMTTSEAAQKLGLTATSVSRASRQLEDMGLIRTEKRGVQKIISSGKTPKELFTTAENRMLSPVKRTIFVPKAAIDKELPLSGYSALSEYTMINPPTVTCLAAGSVSAREKLSTGRLQDPFDQFEVEFWRYDPGKLTDGRCVDRLSLALALKDDRDERVEEAVNEMLTHVWREIDGQRH